MIPSFAGTIQLLLSRKEQRTPQPHSRLTIADILAAMWMETCDEDLWLVASSLETSRSPSSSGGGGGSIASPTSPSQQQQQRTLPPDDKRVDAHLALFAALLLDAASKNCVEVDPSSPHFLSIQSSISGHGGCDAALVVVDKWRKSGGGKGPREDFVSPTSKSSLRPSLSSLLSSSINNNNNNVGVDDSGNSALNREKIISLLEFFVANEFGAQVLSAHHAHLCSVGVLQKPQVSTMQFSAVHRLTRKELRLGLDSRFAAVKNRMRRFVLEDDQLLDDWNSFAALLIAFVWDSVTPGTPLLANLFALFEVQQNIEKILGFPLATVVRIPSTNPQNVDASGDSIASTALKLLATETDEALLALAETALPPNIQIRVLSDFGFKVTDEYQGWRLQKHRVTGFLRLLNPDGVRLAWGTERAIMKALESMVNAVRKRLIRLEHSSRVSLQQASVTGIVHLSIVEVSDLSGNALSKFAPSLINTQLYIYVTGKEASDDAVLSEDFDKRSNVLPLPHWPPETRLNGETLPFQPVVGVVWPGLFRVCVELCVKKTMIGIAYFPIVPNTQTHHICLMGADGKVIKIAVKSTCIASAAAPSMSGEGQRHTICDFLGFEPWLVRERAHSGEVLSSVSLANHAIVQRLIQERPKQEENEKIKVRAIKSLLNFAEQEEEDVTIPLPELKQLALCAGFPTSHRAILWEQAIRQRCQSSHHYEILQEVETVRNRTTVQIDKDAPRTFANHQFWRTEAAQLLLRRFLRHVCLTGTGIGYCQSFNVIAATLLMVTAEEHAHWMFSCLICHNLPDYYGSHLIGVQIDAAVVEEILRRESEELSDHLHDVGVGMDLVAVPWLMQLFVGCVPSETALRIWDIFFTQGRDALVAAAAAVLLSMQDELLTVSDMSDLLPRIQSLALQLFDADALARKIQSILSSSSIKPIRAQHMRQKSDKLHVSELGSIRKATGINEATLALLQQKFTETQGVHRVFSMEELPKTLLHEYGVSLEKFSSLLQQVGISAGSQWVELLFKAFDKAQDGFVDFRELCAGIAMWTSQSPEDRIRLCFEAFDVAKNGSLSREQFELSLSLIWREAMNRSPPPKYVEWAFNAAVGEDGRVSWSGFKMLCRQDLALTHLLHLGTFDSPDEESEELDDDVFSSDDEDGGEAADTVGPMPTNRGGLIGDMEDDGFVFLDSDEPSSSDSPAAAATANIIVSPSSAAAKKVAKKNSSSKASHRAAGRWTTAKTKGHRPLTVDSSRAKISQMRTIRFELAPMQAGPRRPISWHG